MSLHFTRHIIGVAALSLLFVASMYVSAPGASAAMSRAETETVSRQFLDGMLIHGQFDAYCINDLAVTIFPSGQQLTGVGEARQAFAAIRRGEHSTHLTIESLVIGEGIASAEITLTTIVVDDQGYIVAAGRIIRTHHSLFLTLDAGKVTSVRIYGINSPLDVVMFAETGTPYGTLPGGGPH